LGIHHAMGGAVFTGAPTNLWGNESALDTANIVKSAATGELNIPWAVFLDECLAGYTCYSGIDDLIFESKP
jgi:hypothetical protein